jgi:protein TonB
LLPSHGRRRIVFAGAASFSMALHVGAFLACFEWWKPASLGAIELPTEVVSIELAASHVLEAQPQSQRQEPAPAMAAVAPVEGNAEATTERSREPPRAEEEAPKPPVPEEAKLEPGTAIPEEPQTVANAEALPAGPVDESSARPVEQPAKAEPKKVEEPKLEPKKQRTESKQETRKGGVASRARSGTGAGAARASASAGSVLSYAAYVRARVVGNKPSGTGHRGTTTVSFGVTASGGLAYASIGRSSGDTALDRLALGAVRGAAPFPPPPLGTAPGRLRFSIAFHFQ